jgi:hypothetical protein
VRQESFGSCDPTPCLTLSVSGLPALPETVSAAARDSIYRAVAAVLYAPYGEAEQSVPRSATALRASLKELFDSSVNSKLSDAPIQWQLERLATVAYADDELITFDICSRGYVGGAHGFDERWLLSFKSIDGAQQQLEDLVEKRSISVLATIVDAELRRGRGIPSTQSLQDAGFFVTAQSSLPLSNLGLVKEGLLIRFNPYDIAPYAMGPTEIVVPHSALKPLLKKGSLHGGADSLAATALDVVNEAASDQPHPLATGGNSAP